MKPHADIPESQCITVLGTGGADGCIAIVDANGDVLVQINVFVYPHPQPAPEAIEHVIVDVIDVGKRFDKHQAVTFVEGARAFTPATTLVSADFRK